MTTDLRDQLQATLGRAYSIERELGGGGMARVFVAEETALGRKVVIKVLPPEMSGTVSLERFKREVQFAARLQHPHIVPLLNAGEADDLLYYTMPLIEGDSLRWSLTRAGGLPVSEAVRLLRDVVDALCYAHEHGVVHRDLKPENVLVSGRHAMVTDFGIAKALSAAAGAQSALTSAGLAVGTPAYMAPEQAAGDPSMDHRADIYSVGVLAYELLAGRPPFGGLSQRQLLIAHPTIAPDPVTTHRPSVPPALAALVMRCLAKHPADRPQTAEEILRELEAIATTPSEGSTAAPLLSLLRSAAKRSLRGHWLVTGVLALLLLAAGVWSATRRERASVGVARSGAASAPRVVVLPFENLGRPEDEYFADGLTEEITSRLASVSRLTVIGRASARQYKQTAKGPREIAKELGVTHLLTGTVRWEKAADGTSRVRVSPQLVRASDQTSVWADPYEGPLSDVFRFQTSVAEQVAQAMDVALLASERRSVGAHRTENLEAYVAYLRGLANSTRPKMFTDTGRRAAIADFERAVALDPGFAAAHARLALVYLYAGRLADDTTSVARARASVNRAVALDSALLDSRLARGWYLLDTRDPAGADRVVATLLRSAPSNSEVIYLLGQVQEALGRPDDAITSYERAAVLDPRSADPPAALSGLYDALHRHEEAIRMREREIALAPDLGTAYEAQARSHLLWHADTAAARREIERGIAAAGLQLHIYPRPAGVALWFRMLPPSARHAIDTVTLDGYGGSPGWYYVLKARQLAYGRGDQNRARVYCDSARRVLEPVVRAGLGFEFTYIESWRHPLAIADAFLGRAEEATRLMDEVVEAARRSSDARDLPRVLVSAAYVDATVGRRGIAVARLEEALRLPSGFYISRALLRADPSWAPLRGHAGFARLIAEGP